MRSGGDTDDRLDRAFMALADPVRRAIVARLSRGPATVNELAAPFSITSSTNESRVPEVGGGPSTSIFSAGSVGLISFQVL